MKKLLMPGLLLAAMSLHSCDDKDFDNSGPAGEPLSAGSEVLFGAVLDGGHAQSRTVYGDEVNGVFPIYWKYSQDDNDLDRIYIHSPQGATGNERAQYIVKPEGEKFEGYSQVIHASEESLGVMVGESGESHHFYGFYPVSQVLSEKFDQDGKQAYLYGLMPSVQKVTFPAVADATTKMYVGEHNMNYCFMTAHTEVIPTAGKSVQLQFEPWSTVLDITLPGPKETDADESVTITDIIVRSMANAEGKTPEIAGTFRYDFPAKVGDKGSITFETVGNDPTTEPDHILTVEVYNSEGKKGVELKKGELLNLKAFLLPVENVAAITVEVYAAGNKMWDIDLKKPDNRDLLTPGMIHKVSLPNIKLPGKDDYSSWMTELSDKIPVSELSIPGSFESFSYKSTNPLYKLQKIDIAAQFEAGIRAFRARVKLFDGTDTRIGLNENGKHLGVTVDGNEEIMPLGEAIHVLHQEMQSRGNREFCVLMLSQSDIVEDPDLSKSSTSNRDYYKMIKKYAEYMVDHQISPDNVTELTLGKFRGKVLLQGLLNAAIPTSMKEYWVGDDVGILTPMYNIQRYLNPGGGNTNSKWEPVDQPGDLDIGPKSWFDADGAPMLLSWTTKVKVRSITTEEKEATITPVTFGRVGAVGTDLLTYDKQLDYIGDFNTSGWVAPTTTDQIPGLAYLFANCVFYGTTYHDKSQGNTTSLDGAYKSIAKFSYKKLVDGDAQYLKWFPNGINDPRYTWWLRTDVPWNPNNSADMFIVARDLWEGGYTSEAYKLYISIGSRLLMTTDMATVSAKRPSFQNISWNVNSHQGVNYYSLSNILNSIIDNISVVTNSGSVGAGYLPKKNFTASQLLPSFQDMPLGTWFLYMIPDRDEDYKPTADNKAKATDDGYITANSWHVKQMITLLIDQSIKISNKYN